MKLYHGTTVPGIEILGVNSLNREGRQILYLTDNWAYSLFYIRDREINFVTCGVGRDGKVYYEEKFPGQLQTLYRGMSGYVYETHASGVQTKIPGIYVCDQNAAVNGVEYIPDVYDAIGMEIRKGNVVFTSFEGLTPEQIRQNHHGMVLEFLGDRIQNPSRLAFLREHFPKAWAEAQEIRERKR